MRAANPTRRREPTNCSGGIRIRKPLRSPPQFGGPTTTIADTGPLYALMDVDDVWHGRVVEWWKQNRHPVLVPMSVIPEVAYLLQARIGPAAELAFIRAIAAGEFVTEPIEPDDIGRAADVMEEYADLSLGFVDASVIAVAERVEAREILTTDRRHFGTVRPRHARALLLVP